MLFFDYALIRHIRRNDEFKSIVPKAMGNMGANKFSQLELRNIWR
ncbi:protein of unknown function [Clostridium beijerinckii]|nr:protein of unknown function [Clostridium beijerinckii]